MSKLSQKVLFGLTVLALPPVGGIIWDYQTRTGFRKTAPYNVTEGFTRIRNKLYSYWPLKNTLPFLNLKQLAEQDGTNEHKIIQFGAGGIIYDVSTSDLFQPDGPYGSLWAGRDATLSLAKMSFEAKHINSRDWDSLTEEDRSGLTSWLEHFDAKYYRVALLKEYFEPGITAIQQRGEDLLQAGWTIEDVRPNQSTLRRTLLFFSNISFVRDV